LINTGKISKDKKYKRAKGGEIKRYDVVLTFRGEDLTLSEALGR